MAAGVGVVSDAGQLRKSDDRDFSDLADRHSNLKF